VTLTRYTKREGRRQDERASISDGLRDTDPQYNDSMERDRILAALHAHEPELRAAGIVHLSLFGSVARGERTARDVDVAVRLRRNFSRPGLDYIRFLDELEQRLSGILGCDVDVVEEPVDKDRFQREIDRDRVLAF